MMPVALVMMSGQPQTGIHAYTRAPTLDPRPGAEPVDATTTQFLRRGFALIAALDCAAIVSLPVLQGWRARLAQDIALTTPTLTIEEHGVTIYTGTIEIDIPPDWHRTLSGRGSVGLLIASNLPPAAQFMESIDHARLAGTLVGATIPLTD